MADIVDLLQDIAQKIRPCPQITLQRAYLRAAREWCRQSQWYGVNVDAVLTVDTASYDINQLGQLEALNIESVSLQPLPVASGVRRVPLNRGDATQFVPDNTSGQCRRFAYIPEGVLMFDPPPDRAYPVTVRILCQPTRSATTIPDELVVKWQTAFELGALSYLYDLSGEPWANPAEAKIKASEFRSRINDGKADKQRGYVVGSVRARPQPFVTRGFGWRAP
jgi:hypothetical protein